MSSLSFRRWNEEKPIAGVVRLNHGAGFIEHAEDRRVRAREELRVVDRIAGRVRLGIPLPLER